MPRKKSFLNEIKNKSVEEIVVLLAKEEPDVAISKLTKGVVETLKSKASSEPAEYSPELNKKAGSNAAYQNLVNQGASITACVVALSISAALGGPTIDPSDPIVVSITAGVLSGLTAIIAAIRKRMENKKKYQRKPRAAKKV